MTKQVIPTGYSKLDQYMGGGLHCGRVTLLAAWAGRGTTTVALEFVRAAIAHRHPVLYCKTDQTKTNVVAGLASCLQESLRTVEVREDVQSISDLRAAVETFKKNGVSGSPLVVIDWVSLLTNPQCVFQSRTEERSRIFREVQILSREAEIAILAILPLTRRVLARVNKRPVLQDLRVLGGYDSDADTILFLHWEKFYGTKMEIDMVELAVAKHRGEGELGTVQFRFDSIAGRLIL